MIAELKAPTRGIDLARVRCETDQCGPLTFELSPAGGEAVGVSSDDPVEHEGVFIHSAEFTDLAPGTDYTLSARCGDEAAGPLELSTLPRPDGEHLFRFGVLADPHCTDRQRSAQRLYGHSMFLAEKYLERLQEMGAQFVLLPGDVVDDGQDEAALDRVVEIIDELRVPCYVTLGNNDTPPTMFLEKFGLQDGYYSFDHGGVHFTCLMTINGAELGRWSRQREWLVEDIEDNSDRRTVLVSHFALAKHPRLREMGNSEVKNAIELCQYMRSHEHVRAAFSGHKNLPSLHRNGQVAHIVCPQVVQYDTAFNVVDVYSDALVNVLYEIDELDLMRRSRRTMNQETQEMRYGPAEQRNFAVPF